MSSSTKKVVIIDGKGHLLGRLAAIVAKEILNGQKIVVVRAEEIQMSGSLFRSKIRYWQFLRKRMNTNPRRGPFHERSPAAVFKRTVRGMVPYKTARGESAMDRLSVYEGVPPHYVRVKKMVVPQAIKILRLSSKRKFARLGDMSAQVGWNKASIVAKLEAKRKVAGEGWHRQKNEALKLKNKSVELANKALTDDERVFLEKFGY